MRLAGLGCEEERKQAGRCLRETERLRVNVNMATGSCAHVHSMNASNTQSLSFDDDKALFTISAMTDQCSQSLL